MLISYAQNREDLYLWALVGHRPAGTYVDERFTVRHSGAHSTSGQFGMSLLWSYESAVRFHRAQGSPVAGYRCYVVADSIARAAIHLVRRRAGVARSYFELASRAARELFLARPVQ